MTPLGQGGSVSLYAGWDAEHVVTGGSINCAAGSPGTSGGDVTADGGDANVGLTGGRINLSGGNGNDGDSDPAILNLDGGAGDNTPGRVWIQTGGTWGDSGDVLTAQGDGTALWAAPAASAFAWEDIF